MDCNGNCPSCRASTVHNELTDESKEWLVRAYATLARRFQRPTRPIYRRQFFNGWEYPYE
jgi:hypothetical protein